MALNFKIATAVRNAAADAVVDRLDASSPPAVLRVRVGAPPTNVNDASSGTLLGTVTFPNPAFGAASSGVATAGTMVSDTNADNSGEAGYFRVYQNAAAGDTAAEWQGTAGVSGDTPDLVFDNDVIVAGGTIAISAMTITMPIQ